MITAGDIVKCMNASASDSILKEDALYQVQTVSGERLVLEGIKTRFAPHEWYNWRFAFVRKAQTE